MSGESDVSSKRFISLFGLFLFTIAFICSLFGVKIIEEVWYTLTSLILGSSLLTLTSNKSRNL